MKHVLFLLSALILACGQNRSVTNAPNTLGQPAVVPVSLPNNPEELGDVQWSRDLGMSEVVARKTGKPLLILFQEVPGCSNCTRYGNGPLRHPLLVEAIETLFVPVCIYNNKGGADAAALRRFSEPSWNNPVVRIVTAEGVDVVSRLADFGSPAQLVNGMLTALQRLEKPAPTYLRLLAEEWEGREANPQLATFSMYCFWSGEGTFGSLPGVLSTEPGFQNGHEVVQVTYNPQKTSPDVLQKTTQSQGIKACERNTGFSIDRTPKYYMAQTAYRFVPMTPLQATRANSLLGKSEKPDVLLSPRQLLLLKAIQAEPNKKWVDAIGTKDLANTWKVAWKKYSQSI